MVPSIMAWMGRETIIAGTLQLLLKFFMVYCIFSKCFQDSQEYRNDYNGSARVTFMEIRHYSINIHGSQFSVGVFPPQTLI